MNTAPNDKVQVRVHIRWMIRRDMPEVLAIEHASFEFPWGEEEFLRVLRQRNCIGMVAEQGERVVGFMIYELHKNKLHIMNFAVHPGYETASMWTTICDNYLVGAKGVGEAGTLGSTPCIVAAVVDALSGFGVKHIDMMLRPEKLWRVISQGGQS